MLVYGDRSVRAAPQEVLRGLTARLRAAEASDGRPRHDQLVAAFIDAAGLAQGIADAEFEAAGVDTPSAVQDLAMALVLALARKLAASWASGYVAAGPPVAPELMGLALAALPAQVTIREPEGYAFYAVYPEAYLKAAASHPWGKPPLVIGLRSIGTGLAALAAAVTNAGPVVTLRPCGEPFRREVRISDALRRRFAAHDGPFAIADEGPGLSGSSFGATADMLESLGVAPERIVFLPSHAGAPGPQADPRHRARWARAARPVAAFADLLADEPLADTFADLTGPITAVADLSGGAWREALPPEARPPANPSQERLKFRLHTASGVWLAKFAGLGAIGERKFERAKALHQAGFTPEPLALRRGFILERWEAGGSDLGDRAALVERLGAYVAFRASALPAAPDDGADPAALVEMARVNVQERFGEAIAADVVRRLQPLCDAALTPCAVDARLHPWEWLRTPDGLLLKTDALDHAEAHDLVGGQDIGWDIAGALVEFDLTPGEVAQLCDAVAVQSRRRPAPAVVDAFALAYAAFQLGLWTFASQAAGPADRRLIAAHLARYEARLTQPGLEPGA